MREIYGSHHVQWSHDLQNKIVVTVDNTVATVDTDSLVSGCGSYSQWMRVAIVSGCSTIIVQWVW